jgi:hypothetical protein
MRFPEMKWEYSSALKLMIFQGMSDPETMEATACREGMALASDLNLQHIKLASECANDIRRIQSGDVLGHYGQIVRE